VLVLPFRGGGTFERLPRITTSFKFSTGGGYLCMHARTRIRVHMHVVRISIHRIYPLRRQPGNSKAGAVADIDVGTIAMQCIRIRTYTSVSIHVYLCVSACVSTRLIQSSLADWN
jgi:hypothetical protein